MYMNVNFVDLSNTIYVSRSLWDKTTDLRSVLDHTAKPWTIDKIIVNGAAITEHDLNRELRTLGEYEIQIEKHK